MKLGKLISWGGGDNKQVTAVASVGGAAVNVGVGLDHGRKGGLRRQGRARGSSMVGSWELEGAAMAGVAWELEEAAVAGFGWELEEAAGTSLPWVAAVFFASGEVDMIDGVCRLGSRSGVWGMGGGFPYIFISSG